MRKKHVFSLLLFGVGVALLSVALTAGVATSATRSHTSGAIKKGGTLKINQSSTDFDTVDPQLAYVTNDWALLYTTQILLVNFPEKAGQAGSVLYPEGATAFPTISKTRAARAASVLKVRAPAAWAFSSIMSAIR